MLINKKTYVLSSKPILVPYKEYHVPRYHEWMQDPEIQEATASEPLTLEEEYAMQRSWRQDPDKVTFIICRPVKECIANKQEGQTRIDVPSNMIGDINLFLRVDDGEEGGSEPLIIGEIELMIAEKVNQGKGFGKAALLMFLKYILRMQRNIVGEFVGGGAGGVGSECLRRLREGREDGLTLDWFSVKIGKENTRSLALFESVGFTKVSEEANFFGEFELRREVSGAESVNEMLEKAGVYRVQVWDLELP